jgi:hypothetical protein
MRIAADPSECAADPSAADPNEVDDRGMTPL